MALAVASSAAESAKDRAARRALGDRRPAERLKAAEELRYGRARVPTSVLEPVAASDANPQLRYRALQALAVQDAAAAVPALSRALSADPAPIVRVAAAQELGRFDSVDAARALAAALRSDADADVRRACAASLGVQRSTESVAALSAAAGQGDPGVRRLAAISLGRHPSGAARDGALSRLERDADSAVASEARRARRGGGRER